MTRISTYNSFSFGTQGLLQGQTNMAKAQAQASSQKTATDLKGYGNQAKQLVGAKTMATMLEKRTEDLKTLQARADIEAEGFNSFTETISSLRSSIGNAVANENGAGFAAALEAALANTISAANLEFAGQSIFGGNRAYEAPFINADLNALAAEPNTDLHWLDTGDNRNVTLEAGHTIELSKSAQEVFKPFVEFVRNVRAWENANTPITGRLNAAQMTFLKSQFTAIGAIETTAFENQAAAGIVNKQISDIIESNENRLTTLNAVVGKIENVDLAEVATRLTAAQTQYQASASIFAQLKNLNLLQFLR